jgi:hypothetical protein
MVLKREAELRSGEFRIDRLVRIKTRLSRSKWLKAAHAISGDPAFWFDVLLLTKFSDLRGN